jgi:hypothetical protein
MAAACTTWLARVLIAFAANRTSGLVAFQVATDCCFVSECFAGGFIVSDLLVDRWQTIAAAQRDSEIDGGASRRD